MGRLQRKDTNLWSDRQSWLKLMDLKIKPKDWNLGHGGDGKDRDVREIKASTV